MDASTFPRTSRTLQRARSPIPPAAVASLTVALLAWLLWFTRAELGVFAVSDSAHVAVQSEPHRVQSAVDAPVIEVLVGLGQPVERGALLIRLDAQRVSGELGELRVLAASLEQELEHGGRREVAERSALESEGATQSASAQEAEARLAEAKEAYALAEADRQRVENLSRQGLASAAELERAKLESVSKESELVSAEAARDRRRSEGATVVADRRSSLARGAQEREAVEGRLQQARAAMDRLDSELGLYELRAPVTGHVAWLGAFRVGSVVQQGDALATVVPEGELKVVATFPAIEAVGRVRPGQDAWLRLDGFPWTRYGSVRAKVERVASESRDGSIQVELAITQVPDAIPLQHGLPGRVEVEVESATPAELVLRAAGRPRSAAKAAARAAP